MSGTRHHTRLTKAERDLLDAAGDETDITHRHLSTFGACRGADLDIFFPARYGSTAEPAEEALPALAVCHSCPLEAACLGWALDFSGDSFDGVIGGTIPKERRRILRRRIRDAERSDVSFVV